MLRSEDMIVILSGTPPLGSPKNRTGFLGCWRSKDPILVNAECGMLNAELRCRFSSRSPSHIFPFFLIPFFMAFSEDVKKVFHIGSEGLGGSEICVKGNLVVISGHKGLLSLSEEEVSVRLHSGRVLLSGKGLAVKMASPSEIYVEGRIDSLLFPREEEG